MAARKHSKVAIEYFSDASKEVEWRWPVTPAQTDPNWNLTDSPDFSDETKEFRIVKRKFVEGEWYPCLIADDARVVLVWNGLTMQDTHNDTASNCFDVKYIEFIGESLGKLKFK